MQLGDAIVLAAIVLALAGVTIAFALIFKKKTIAITFFIIFIALLGVSLVFKNDLVKFLAKSINDPDTSAKSYRTVSFKGLDHKKLYLNDVLFYWNKPWAISQDTSLVIYLNENNNNFGWNYNTNTRLIYNKKKGTQISVKEIFYGNSNVIKDINFPQDYLISDLAIMLFKDKKLNFIGINGNNLWGFLYKYEDYYLSKIIKIFGNFKHEWISKGDQIRIYQIRDAFFYFYGGRCFAIGVSTDDNFDPTQVKIFSDGLEFRREK